MRKNIKKLSLIFVLLFPVLLHAEIYTMKITGPIESITEEYIVDSFKKVKEESKGKLVIIEMDTPGGLDKPMRTVIKEIMASPVPVAVYVSPKGAQAASAGFFITIAADIACMSPGTNTGSAHPVLVTGGKMDETMNEKVTNDAVAYARSLARSRNRNEELAQRAVRKSESFTAEDCLKNNLIEYIAEDINDLLKQLEERKVSRVNGETIVLKLEGEKIVPLDMSSRQKFLKTITNPSLAYFLLIIGLIGLYLEFTHPGVIVPGVVGGICLLLAFLAFQILPINYVGLLLILLSIGFFIAEIKIQGFGMFGIGGIISFLLGSIILINAPIPEMRPAMSMIIVFTVVFGIVFLFLTYKVIQAMRRRTETGQEGLAGEIGIAKSEITPTMGKVFVHGEWWNAVSASGETIPADTKVKIEAIEGVMLKVSPTPS
ncbi:MAG: nodulation protein NfeD [Candidatus Aminicenantes bacterium]|nr:nodulation protein NfeD [Candidatus Aminicenantes bacterium]NIM84015.1 nodulation protein NfeD [Candidatus Aminicenantes bacterium]NIN23493.1 nodulation protein NfeD [Candidatus Aminicenantes bacterium]NIN47198.1 nodulation protein NfeD [Candidatus Aminicenantes bacterium]NIN90122.1 nodulation protein NfeD [Candidatus Aminicenantes bacterium]